MNAEETVGGDPVCWLDRTCPECGAMPSAESPGRCWRCGRPLHEEPVDDADPA